MKSFFRGRTCPKSPLDVEGLAGRYLAELTRWRTGDPVFDREFPKLSPAAIACAGRARTLGPEQRTTWHVLCLRRFRQ